MRHAPKLRETTPPGTQEKASSTEAPVMKRAGQRAQRRNGETHKRTVLGREIIFTLTRIPHAEIEERTQVWALNERDQELLTDAALSDILPSFLEEGQEEPAYGRTLEDNRLETADGSRRRMACIKTSNDYLIWNADLSDDEMEHISQIGNKYLPPSAYERGKRYCRLIDSGKYPSAAALSKAEGVDRKIIQRCRDTAQLPREIITLYRTVNDISARAGSELYRNLSADMELLARNPEFRKQAPGMPAEQVTAALLDTHQRKAKAKLERTWSNEALRIDHNGGNGLKIEIGEDVPESVLKRIEKILRKELQIEQ